MKPIKITEKELIDGIKNSTLQKDRVYLLEKETPEGTLQLPLAYNKFGVDALPEESYEGNKAISLWSVFTDQFKNNRKIPDSFDSNRKTHNYIDWNVQLKEYIGGELEQRVQGQNDSVLKNWHIAEESKGLSEKAIKTAIDGLVKQYFDVRERLQPNKMNPKYKGTLRTELSDNVLSYFTEK